RLVDAIVRLFERSRLGTRLNARVLDRAPEVRALRERIATLDDERRHSLARINELESVGVLRELEQFVVAQTEDLHLNACGDFQLMAREDWLNLRGYPELDVEEHGDELLSAAAHYAGIREHVLPARACVFRLDREAHAPDAMGPRALEPLWSDASVP